VQVLGDRPKGLGVCSREAVLVPECAGVLVVSRAPSKGSALDGEGVLGWRQQGHDGRCRAVRVYRAEVRCHRGVKP